MEHSIFKKAKLAAAIALVSSTTLMTGCLVDGDKSTTTSTTVQEDASRISVTDQVTPRAEILGIVQDTNGNPVAGARVSIGSASAISDANGAYSIPNVAVTGFTGNADTANAQPIQVSIVPANSVEGVKYLAATVSVTPQASTIIQTVDGDHTNTEDALLAIVTTDGLAVSAGVTVIPALESTVTGVLRDNATGEVVANAVIGLEVLEVNGVNQQQVQNSNGGGTSYGVGIYQAATDAEGRFTFENLPVDTDFDIAINGWILDSLTGGNVGNNNSGEFATTPEVAVQNIGTVYADLITSQDDIEPFVTSVTGVVVNAVTGLLNDDLDGTQGLTVHFSEPLQSLVDSNSVYVYNTTAKAAVALQGQPVLSADGRSVTITTASPIPANNTFEIYLNKMDFQDIAGNALDAGVVGTFKGQPTPAYDANVTLGNSNSLKLTLKTFADPITEAGAVVGLTQQLEDGGDSAFEILQGLNSTFIDVDTGTLRSGDVSIEQLNEPESEDRLKALSDATYGEAGLAGAPVAVAADVARVQFTIDGTTEASAYKLELKNALGVAQFLTLDVSPLVGTLANNGTTAVTLTLNDGFQGVVDLLAESVEPGWTLSIASLTDFGSEDGIASVVLTDQLAPTTVLQNSYGAGDSTTSVVGLNYGNGGELSDITTATVGTPLLNITPRLLTPQVGETPALPVGDTWTAVRDLMDIDSNGNAQVDTSGLPFGTTAYDAKAFAAWAVGDRKIGIAMSEDVTLTGTPTHNASQSLSDWKVQNDVVVNDQNNPVTADLINVTVPDVIAFANTDHGSVIDFTGNITDNSGNTATAANNPKVVVNDLMPPMPVSAVYNGEKIILTYNENVSVVDGTEFILDGLSGDKTFTVDTADVTVSGATVTIPRSVFGDIDSEQLFDRGTYDHDDDNTNADAAHGVVLTRDVEDLRGVSWANWDGGAGLVDIPGIVIRDDAGVFETSTPLPTGFANAATGFSVVYRFSHRIDLQNSFGAASASSMTGAEVDLAFTLTTAGTGIINTANGTSASLDPTGRVLTVTVAVVGDPIATGDTFGLTGGTIQSEWDSNDPVITTLNDITAQ
ncbi:carboxypeptidase-like regulatory domain-containing protein [Thalassolituus marinus]|uniref:Carboxypeptidase regulatory-like domain-containing protein n=1 Tax=Thalassolituus marinus TaxID=671053 RepID=A0ABS7ZNM4_9GAMM|nr:carboxypeptidase-like regulatory domain-containing protein [Thalassolituus marinus]MCA6062071.1 carboxypeptidase regulatory-like domain-containing protein [Thalassolituus marinus]